MSHSWYLTTRPFGLEKFDEATEAEDVHKLAEWVAEHGSFDTIKGITQITNHDMDHHLERILRRPGISDDVCR
jgi:hypothetical protein